MQKYAHNSSKDKLQDAKINIDMHIIRILKITEESNFNTIVCTVKTCQKEGRELKFFYTLKLLQLLEEGVPRCYS